MAIYDSREISEALERPVLRLEVAGKNGKAEIKEYQGILMSQDEWMPWAPKLATLAAPDVAWEEKRELVRDFTDATFPVPVTWKFWRWRLPASYYLLKQPPLVMWRLFEGFLRCQAETVGIKVPDLAQRTEGPAEAVSPTV